MAFAGDYAHDAKLVFIEHRKLNNDFLATVKSSDLEDHKLKRRKLVAHTETAYTVMLSSLEQQFCINPRTDVLDEFIATLVNTSNSADEYPSLVFAGLFSCKPDLVVNMITLLVIDDKNTVRANLKWGFKNITYKKEGIFANYKVLLDKLNSIMKDK